MSKDVEVSSGFSFFLRSRVPGVGWDGLGLLGGSRKWIASGIELNWDWDRDWKRNWNRTLSRNVT